MVSQYLSKLKSSPVMALATRAQELKKQGVDVVSLSIGEPAWQTPESICSAGKKAIALGHTKYTPASGTLELRQSIVDYTQKTLKLDVGLSQVTVSIGAKFILFSALQALCDPEDEVLVPAPYWVSYPAMAQLVGARFVPIPLSKKDGFCLTPQVLERFITPRSKVLILNSPNNPTGFVFSKEQLKVLGDFLKTKPHLFILSDDIYNDMCFSGSIAPHLRALCPDLADRVLCVNSVSKNYSMTGWRVGWAVGKENIIQAMSRFQSQTVSCASSISQFATTWALKHGDKEVENLRKSLITTYKDVLKKWQNIKGLKVFPPKGAFYLWIGVQDLLNRSYKGQKISSSAVFAEKLLQAESVLCVPGEAFGCSGYVRINFTVTKQLMDKALFRIKRFISHLE